MLLYHLCEREIARKNERRIEMTLKLARFPFVRDLTGFDFAAQPTRWGQLLFGIICMVMIANLQYG
jgi:DNA replication protein DnaC